MTSLEFQRHGPYERPAANLAPNRNGWVGTLLSLFLITSIIVPAAPVNKLIFIMLFARVLFDLLLRARLSKIAAPALIVPGIFMYGFFRGMAGEVRLDFSIQFLLAVFILSLIHLVERYDIDMDRIAAKAGVWFCIFSIMFWVMKINPEIPFSTTLVPLFEDYSLSAAAERDYLEEPTLVLRLGNVPFLFIPWCLTAMEFTTTWKLRHLLWLLVLGTIITISGSRALVVLSLLFLIVALMRRTSIPARVLLGIAVGFSVFALIGIIVQSTALLSMDEVSNAGKIGHFLSFVDYLTPFNSIFGSGLASFYYSMGNGLITPVTEITPLDMVRYFGFPLTLLLFTVIAMPTTRLSAYGGDNRMHVFAFALFLLMSTTNPVLFNSVGMLVTLWYWARIRRALPGARQR
ncbi:hypothetical protein [Azohydromonas lata]|uniref:O-antigen ligase domain-containing protein n=1 Tax=Azohydromonas lata TaxID=45677 RepID=A0ABU5IBR1_9BURK|nr:hypothetical protein [Azohydromonas lata]MDZ5456526.1 hypothetical protein [Azohydromonas lata]